MSGEGNVAPSNPPPPLRPPSSALGPGYQAGQEKSPGELDALAALLGTHREVGFQHSRSRRPRPEEKEMWVGALQQRRHPIQPPLSPCRAKLGQQ